MDAIALLAAAPDQQAARDLLREAGHGSPVWLAMPRSLASISASIGDV
nr:hypothetical protein [uncultured Lichenicoccus sp.]